jgi:hypothetical protein
MESNSFAGKIHCSVTSAKLLQTQAPDIPCFLRGKISVKGKGNMMTYWVGGDNLMVGEQKQKQYESQCGAPVMETIEDVSEQFSHHMDMTDVNLNIGEDYPHNNNGNTEEQSHNTKDTTKEESESEDN